MTALDAIKRFTFNVVVDSHQPQNFDVQATLGDDLELTHRFYDRQGNALTLESVTATLRIAQKNSATQVHEITEAAGISITSTKSVATIDTEAGIGAPGTYTYQLRLTKSGNTLAAVQGDIDLLPLIE